jgi:predicted ATPase
MQEHLGRHTPERLLALPDLTDPEKRMVMNLLFQSIPAAIQTCPPLFILAELIMFDIAVEHGLTPMSAKNFVDCGIIQGGMLGDYATAYRLGRVAFEVLERYDARAIASAVHFVFGTYVSSWCAPHREALEALEACYRLGMDTGDIQHMGFGAALRTHRLLHVGHELSDCEREV